MLAQMVHAPSRCLRTKEGHKIHKHLQKIEFYDQLHFMGHDYFGGGNYENDYGNHQAF